MRQHAWRTVGFVLWALIPLPSLGILASIPVLHAALRLRHPRLWLFIFAYVGLTVRPSPSHTSLYVTNLNVIGNLAESALVLLIVGGTIHAFVLRPQVFKGAQ